MKWRRDAGVSGRPSQRLGTAERVLASARTTGGGWVVGTNLGLHLPAEYTGDDFLGWERIDAATWHKDEGLLVVVTLPVEGRAAVRYDVALPDPRRLPELVRERVTSTILVNQHVSLGDGHGARIVGRRAPGTDEISWTVAYDPGVDADDPEIADRLQDEFEDLRGRLGV